MQTESTCPNGHPTPKEFRDGLEIRCPYSKDGINCDAVYTVGNHNVAKKPAPSTPSASTGETRRIG